VRPRSPWTSLGVLVPLLSVLLTDMVGAIEPPPHHASRPDDHAPIGVMGDHMHHAGEVMLSYRYMRMNMNGNRDGTHRESVSSVLQSYPVAPYDMDMDMHMVGVMYAPHDVVTLTAMLPFLQNEMKHRTRLGVSFTTETEGIGDLQVGGLIRIHDDETHHVHLNAALSVPTGSISEKDDTPAGRMRLPYPMQLGSGTWDLLPGITYTGKTDAWSWGAQALATIRTGTNNKGYRLGNRWEATGWVARKWLPWLSTSLRLDYEDWSNIHGDDDGLNPRVVPTADPNLRAGRRLDVLAGVNFLVTGGFLKGNRFAVEFGRPVWQHLDGPQLETDWLVTAGWQLAF
jgi:hypothetical protein